MALLACLGALVLLLAAAPAALADYLSPQSGSPNANDIDTLYKITFAIGVLIFLLVEGILIYSLFKFRWRRGGPQPAQIRGNAPLEIGWTIGAASILVVLTVVTFIYLGDIKNPQASQPGGLQSAGGVEFAALNQPDPPGGRSLEIEVNGQQYLWRYEYPGREQLFSYYDMYVPVKTTVTLKLTSSDVVHSWWIPKLGGKADATPGHTNETWFRIDQPGSYNGVCAELCGEGHADMRARVIALPVEEYEAWAARTRQDIRRSQTLLALSRKVRGETGQ